MTAPFSASIMISLTLSFALSGCTTKPTSQSTSANKSADTSFSTKNFPNNTNSSGKEKEELTKIYSQAIGDYIRLVHKEYNLTFDTLFFGQHVHGQPDDFPDIELPSTIGNTTIKLVSPEQGEKIQKERPSSFYINLIGWANSYDAEFIFVTFSNGFAHQFDCFITYKYDTNEEAFVIETTRFKTYRYKAK